MKFIITESKLTNLVFDYLNNQDFYKMKYQYGYVFWDSKESWESGGYISIKANRADKECFVNSDLVVEVASFFSLDLETALNIIGEWTKTKIDFDFDYIFSDYGAD